MVLDCRKTGAAGLCGTNTGAAVLSGRISRNCHALKIGEQDEACEY